jgi:hypothetical protein
MRNESGKITTGFLLFIILFAAALDASFQLFPIYMRYLEFKNVVDSRAMEFSQPGAANSEEKIREALMKKAVELDIPLDREHLLIDFENNSTHIKASWSIEATFLAGYYKRKIPFFTEITKPNARS